MKLKKREVDKMTLEQYMRELWLMDKQYGQEIELYPLINMLLRDSANTKDLSIRDVHNGRKTVKRDHRKYIDGFGSFPDLAIFDESFPEGQEPKKGEGKKNTILENIYGCVEVKPIGSKLIECLDHNTMEIGYKEEEEDYYVQIDTKKGILLNGSNGGATLAGQLLGEILWYGKVLYTNGLIWKYYELSKDTGNKINPIRESWIRTDEERGAIPKKGTEEDKKWKVERKTWIFKQCFEQCKKNNLKITITSEEIGNLIDIYQKIKKENKEKEKFEQEWKALKDKKGFEQRWNDFKEKLKNIEWNEDVFTNAETKNPN
ncbi:hypothetical protein DW815_00380 [Ruminococcus sp. AM33-14]|nr:hypothetical protein DW815_00380 [Ruminococcus sp. AM33-14]